MAYKAQLLEPDMCILLAGRARVPSPQRELVIKHRCSPDVAASKESMQLGDTYHNSVPVPMETEVQISCMLQGAALITGNECPDYKRCPAHC